MDEVAELDTVLEEDAIALPVEAVGQDDLALGADGDSVELDGRLDAIVHLERQLSLVR